MRLSYHDHTPEDYEPPYFRSSTGQPEAHFPQGAFKAKLGGVSTPHHAVALRVKSLLGECRLRHPSPAAPAAAPCL